LLGAGAVSNDVVQVPMIIVGNKSDLADQREVSEAEGEEFAKANSALFIETSAKLQVNVNEAFNRLVRSIVTSNMLGAPVASTKSSGKKCVLL
jgi:GTPase SAR1 family protein